MSTPVQCVCRQTYVEDKVGIVYGWIAACLTIERGRDQNCLSIDIAIDLKLI